MRKEVLRIKKNPDRPGFCTLLSGFFRITAFFNRKIKKYGSPLYHGLPHFVANDSNFDRNPLRGCNYGLEGGAFLILEGCSSLPKERSAFMK